jgi:hypothetical protein
MADRIWGGGAGFIRALFHLFLTLSISETIVSEDRRFCSEVALSAPPALQLLTCRM